MNAPRNQEYKQAVDAVASLLFEHDPLGLRRGGAPADEYEPEASAIVLAVGRCHDVEGFTTAVWQVFRDAFGEDIAGDVKVYRASAAAVWRVLRQGNPER